MSCNIRERGLIFIYQCLVLRVLCSHSVALGFMYFPKQHYESIVLEKSNINRFSFGWFGCFWLTSIKRSFSHISTWKQEITNLWKFKWRGGESNPGPLAPQAKSLTTRPPLPLNRFSASHYIDVFFPIAMSSQFTVTTLWMMSQLAEERNSDKQKVIVSGTIVS